MNSLTEETPKKSFEEEEDGEEVEEVEEGSSNSTTKYKVSLKAIRQIFAETNDSTLTADIIDVEKAWEFFLDSKFSEAEVFLLTKYGQSMYFTHGYSMIRTLKALMTHSPDDVQIALTALRSSAKIANYIKSHSTEQKQLRTSTVKKTSWSVMGMFSSKKDDPMRLMTNVQLHAELCASEATILRAMLQILTQTSLVSLLKDGLSIRAAHGNIVKLYKFLETLYDDFGVQGFVDYDIDEHLISGVVAINGNFHLFLSLLPAKVFSK